MKKHSEKKLSAATRSRRGMVPVLLLVAATVLVAAGKLGRDLWFDEALTAIVFMLPYGFREIYFHYTIPNNQIVYTWLLKAWNELVTPESGDPTLCWRLLSVVLALAAIVLTVRFLMREGRRCGAWGAALPGVILSPAFAIYATALRGYAASWLFLLIALYGARDLAAGRFRRGVPLYFAGCLLACGTIPTNLAGCAMAALYGLSRLRGNLFRKQAAYALVLIPLAAFMLFWGPIWGDLRHAAALGEGAQNRWAALGAVYGMLALAFLPLAPGQIWLAEGGFRKGQWRWLKLLCWLIPALPLLILPVAPFPRTFVPLLPLYAVLIAEGLNRFLAARRPARRKAWSGVLLLTVLLWGAAGFGMQHWAAAHTSGETDDVLNPWYCRADYQPRRTALELLELTANDHAPVYASFKADPFPLLFYYTLAGGDPGRIQADVRNPVGDRLPPGTWAVLRRDEAPETLEARFHCVPVEQHTTPYHRIFRLP